MEQGLQSVQKYLLETKYKYFDHVFFELINLWMRVNCLLVLEIVLQTISNLQIQIDEILGSRMNFVCTRS